MNLKEKCFSFHEYHCASTITLDIFLCVRAMLARYDMNRFTVSQLPSSSVACFKEKMREILSATYFSLRFQNIFVDLLSVHRGQKAAVSQFKQG